MSLSAIMLEYEKKIHRYQQLYININESYIADSDII